MVDAAPELWELIKYLFLDGVRKDSKIAEILDKIKKKTATHVDTHEYAIRIGEHSSAALMGALKGDILLGEIGEKRLYFNIANRTVRPAMEMDRKMVNEVAVQIQEILNEKANIGMKAVVPKGNEDRIKRMIDRLAEKRIDDVKWLLGAPLKNYVQSVVDDFVYENAGVQEKSGMAPKIIRSLRNGGCEWCRKLAGTYEYADVKETGCDVFRRHDNCQCLVIYDPGDGRRVRNVHTKQEFDTYEDAKRRVRILVDEVMMAPEKIVDYSAIFGSMSPKEWRENFIKAGYEAKRLSQGSRRGLDFLTEDGGWKINFGGDGLIMYHPREGSHHTDEYYKVSYGKLGEIRRYDREGNRIEVIV